MFICLNRATAGGGMPLDQFVALAATAGFAGADVDLEYGIQNGAAKLHDLYAMHDMRFGGWGAPPWRAPDESTLADALGKFEQCARIAGELKIDSCATWIMPSSDRPFTENWEFHVRRLRPVSRVLAEHGLRLGLEFIGPYHLRRQHPHEFIFTPGLMLELADAIGPNVGLLVDCFHVHASGTSLEHLAQVSGDRIVLVHLNDCPNVSLADVQDAHRLIPGQGVLDLKSFIAALKRAGYRGPVSLEIFNADLKQLTPAEAARRAAEGTRRALGGAMVA